MKQEKEEKWEKKVEPKGSYRDRPFELLKNSNYWTKPCDCYNCKQIKSNYGETKIR